MHPPCLFARGPASHGPSDRSTAAGAARESHRPGRVAQVLVIDDDPLIAELLHSVLVEGGHQPSTAVTLHGLGPEGFELIITDLLASDTYRVSEASSWVAEIRRRVPGVPVVVCTAHQGASSEREAIGADAVITKPFDVDVFLSLVDGLTEKLTG